ncbi:MAG: 50S ribosomal protein L35 [Candidatus Omnitrophica bacterium]|nr:50S ribosomal protein L35 [Candidatus Omnitrophota bacterium]
MRKSKTKKGIAKRFKLTKKGKIKSRHAGKGHLLGKKSRKRKRALSKDNIIGRVQTRMIKKALPYGL